MTTNEAIDPKPLRHVNVRDYGAGERDVMDDTEAFRRAIRAAEDAGGGVWVSPGRYLLNGVIPP